MHQKPALVEFELLCEFSGQDWVLNGCPQGLIGLLDCQVKWAGQGSDSLLCAFAHTLV